VTVFAAASTTNAIDEIRTQFAQQSGFRVQSSYAASSTLAQQIVNGAAAGVFVSADSKWADYLDERGLVARRVELLSNRLVVIVPVDSALRIAKPEDLLAAEVEHLALADTAAVPAGVYARQALTRLGLWESLRPRVVAGADVRQALCYVETGAADAGIVYATDAKISRLVRVAAEIPADATEPIRYPVVLLKQAAGYPAAESFYQYLLTSEAADVFRKYGFEVDGERESPP